jgi:hypothetical protein
VTRWLPLLLLAACSGGAVDELAPDTEDAGGECVEVIDPPQAPNCCRTPELAEEFIPSDPLCFRDEQAYEAYRQRYRTAYRAGDCKAVHEGDACTFE